MGSCRRVTKGGQTWPLTKLTVCFFSWISLQNFSQWRWLIFFLGLFLIHLCKTCLKSLFGRSMPIQQRQFALRWLSKSLENQEGRGHCFKNHSLIWCKFHNMWFTCLTSKPSSDPPSFLPFKWTQKVKIKYSGSYFFPAKSVKKFCFHMLYYLWLFYLWLYIYFKYWSVLTSTCMFKRCFTNPFYYMVFFFYLLW